MKKQRLPERKVASYEDLKKAFGVVTDKNYFVLSEVQRQKQEEKKNG